MPEHPSIEQLERRVKADPTSIAFAALAEEYRRAGRYPEAIEVCRTGLARHPAYLSARVTLGRALIEVGALDEARPELERVLEAAPENLAAIRGLAEIHHRRGEIPEATEHYRSALEITEHNAVAREITAPPGEHTGDGLSLNHLQDVLRSAAQPSAGPTSSPAPEDPALVGLERLLDAILRAKQDRERGGPGLRP